jgi:hypothetical protein
MRQAADAPMPAANGCRAMRRPLTISTSLLPDLRSDAAICRFCRFSTF